MAETLIAYGTPVGIFNEGGDVRLDIGLDVASALVSATKDSPTTRFIIRRLGAGDGAGEVMAEHVVGIFSEDGQYRLDIGHDCFSHKVSAGQVSATTVMTLVRLDGPSTGPVRYGDVVAILTSDGKHRLDIDTPPLKGKQAATHVSWATTLRIAPVPALEPAQPPIPPIPPKPPVPPPPGPDTPQPQHPMTTLERIFVGVYEGVKRAQVDVQRGALRKFDWFFPENADKQREARTVNVPIPLAEGGTEVRTVPLFALVPHHDLMIDEVVVKMKVDLLQLTQSGTHPDINEIESSLARPGDNPALFADIEIRLKGTEPVEGVARLNDEIVKRF